MHVQIYVCVDAYSNTYMNIICIYMCVIYYIIMLYYYIIYINI